MDENKVFPEIHGNFGFGCMRLPMTDGKVDIEETKRMVDAFLDAGFNYFDTAHPYIGGQSEKAIKEALTSRYPRDRYILANKLSPNCFEKNEDIRPMIEEQLRCCGVDYFDFLLMHCQDGWSYPRYQAAKAYETVVELKKEGKIRHLAFSFHDTPEYLDKIISEHPEVEAVQIQFNYLDYENPNIRARECYEVCIKHGKPCIVMEPVKGGFLVNMPPKASQLIADLHGGSNASYAVRYAASFNNVFMVLSGMSNMEQMEDNLSAMKDFKPLNEIEMKTLDKVVETLKENNVIQCTKCHYCTDGCPMGIKIPEVFQRLNDKRLYDDFSAPRLYKEMVKDGGKASSCIECGQCETSCPQHLEIRELLKIATKVFGE